MLNQYETTFILTPVLSDDDAKQSINAYVELMKSHGAEVIHQAHWGLKNLKYPIKKKTNGYLSPHRVCSTYQGDRPTRNCLPQR
jgi:small subunit ribosomal protein S6